MASLCPDTTWPPREQRTSYRGLPIWGGRPSLSQFFRPQTLVGTPARAYAEELKPVGETDMGRGKVQWRGEGFVSRTLEAFPDSQGVGHRGKKQALSPLSVYVNPPASSGQSKQEADG